MHYWKKLVYFLFVIIVNYQNSNADTAPTIIDHPVDVIAAKNSNAELRCKATGSPKPTIHWLHDGKRVPTDEKDSENRRYIMPSGNLTFIRVIYRKRGRTDSGKYQCVAVNRAGKATSKAGVLTVGVLRSHFKTEPRDRTVTVGNPVTLKCNPPRGKPTPTVAWIKDGVKLIPDGKRVRIIEPGSLYISPAQKFDQGEYVCQASNPLGKKESNSARLTVKELPATAISINPKTTTVTAGTDVSFQCDYRDGPQGAIRWSKKGGTLPDKRFETTQYGELKIKKAKPGDQGEYVCSVSDSLSVSAVLKVQTKPSITSHPKDVIVREGTKARFSCKATGSPLPTIFWDQRSTGKTMFPHQKNGRFEVKIDGDLIIRNVQKNDKGEFVCSAISQAGVATASATLTVVGNSDTKPTLKIKPNNQTIQQLKDAIFSCTFDGVPVPTIQWLKNQVSPIANSDKYIISVTGSTTQLIVKSATQSDVGQYVCAGTNVLGTAKGVGYLQLARKSTTVLPLLVTPSQSATTTKPAIPAIKRLSPPSHMFAGDITHSAVLLIWASTKSTTNQTITFTVEYRKVGHKRWKTAQHSTTINRHRVTGLKPDTRYEFSVRSKAGKEQSRRTTAQFKTKEMKKIVASVLPVITSKRSPSRNAKVLVKVEPLKWDKLNVTWKFDRHVKKTSAGFNVFWRKKESKDGYKQMAVIGQGVHGHILNGLSENTSYLIQVEVYFSKHFLPKSKEVVGITGSRDKGLLVIIDGGTTSGAEGDVQIIHTDNKSGGTWARVVEFIRKPSFIAITGGILCIILGLIVLLLYRRRRQSRRNLKQRKLKLQIAEIQRPPTSPQGHKTLWMDDVITPDPPAPQLANNRVSDTSSTECLNRSVTSCCARRGINSNTVDFPNKITINSLTGSRLGEPNQFDAPIESKISSEGKTNNVNHSINNYREHLNKTAKFDDGADQGSLGSRSGSEATLPRAMSQQPAFLTPTQQFINRKKANTRADSPASTQKVPNKTPDDSPMSEKTKPKLKIQSFDMASNGSIPSTTTFHADPPPTYEAVLKETELEKQLDGEEKDKSREELAEKLKGTPFSDKPTPRAPSPPLSERSCRTTSSCGSRKRKVLKPPPRLAILNWADLLPPPPSHPPPSSLGSPPPSPPFSLRSGMSGMTGMSGLTGMSGMTGLTGMTGMTGRTGKSSGNGLVDNEIPERPRKKPPSSAVSDSAVSAGPKVPGSTKSGKSGHKHKKTKPKALPIDLEGITSDIIMQWADSVTNTSGSDDDSSCSSPSRVSSTGSFFTDADFANAVRAAAECGGFNMETYGLMDSLGYPPPYSGSWKANTSTPNGHEPSGQTPPTTRNPQNRSKWETGSEGDLDFTPPITVRPRFTRKVQPNENGTPPPVAPSKMAADMGIRKVARSPVPLVPSQPRRPIPRAARMNSNSPVPGPGQIIVQPLKKTSALNTPESASKIPVTKKFAVVKKIPQSKDTEYNSATLSSSGKSSTSTASTVKTSTMGDSDAESAA